MKQLLFGLYTIEIFGFYGEKIIFGKNSHHGCVESEHVLLGPKKNEQKHWIKKKFGSKKIWSLKTFWFQNFLV